MIQDILKQLSGSISDDLVSKAGISKDQVPGVIESIADASTEQMGKEAASGNMGALLNLFSNDSNSSAADGIQASITSAITQKLADKFGFDASTINSIVQVALPKLMGMLTQKNVETDANDPGFLTDLLGGGNTGDLLGKAKDAFGGFFGK